MQFLTNDRKLLGGEQVHLKVNVLSMAAVVGDKVVQ